MNNLFIIGNGFDLAHGLKTSYSDFFKTLVENQLSDKKMQPNLFTTSIGVTKHKSFEDLRKNKGKGIVIRNEFFGILFRDFLNQNWCDIEFAYFKRLEEIKKNKKAVKKLNDEFLIIISYLEKYLKAQQNANKIKVYYDLFNQAKTNGRGLTCSLNFNYTDTVSKNYLNCFDHTIHIHGELFNEKNPIIFGYAANDKESRDLININDNELTRNIKKHCYKGTDNFSQLQQFLSKDIFNVWILGHSCGISDKLILNQILNHEYLEKVQVFYYNSYESYRNLATNIDRIMINDNAFNKKLINFPDSIWMPQHDDGKDKLDEFKDLIKKISFK